MGRFETIGGIGRGDRRRFRAGLTGLGMSAIPAAGGAAGISSLAEVPGVVVAWDASQGVFTDAARTVASVPSNTDTAANAVLGIADQSGNGHHLNLWNYSGGSDVLSEAYSQYRKFPDDSGDPFIRMWQHATFSWGHNFAAPVTSDSWSVHILNRPRAANYEACVAFDRSDSDASGKAPLIAPVWATHGGPLIHHGSPTVDVSFWHPEDDYLHVNSFVVTLSDRTIKHYHDGALVRTATWVDGPATWTLTKLRLSAGSTVAPLEWGGVAIADVAHTQAEVTGLVNLWRQRFPTALGTAAGRTGVLWLGNSLYTGSFAGYQYVLPKLAHALGGFDRRLYGVVVAVVNGVGSEQLAALQAGDYDPILAQCDDWVVPHWEGTNDMFYGATADEAADNSKAIAAYLRARGYRVAHGYVLPRDSFAPSQQLQTDFNARLDSDFLAGHYDLAPIDSLDATLVANWPGPNTYWSDGTHPTASGNTTIDEEFNQAVKDLIALLP